MLSPFWHRLAPGIVLNDFSLGACIVTVFVGFAAEPSKGTFNVENTLAETFNLDRLARYSIMSHP
jgi:hypothetical protein